MVRPPVVQLKVFHVPAVGEHRHHKAKVSTERPAVFYAGVPHITAAHKEHSTRAIPDFVLGVEEGGRSRGDFGRAPRRGAPLLPNS